MAVDYEEGRRLLAEWVEYDEWYNNISKGSGIATIDMTPYMEARERVRDFLLTHAEALLNPDPWRPIEEAPKDGTVICATDNRRDYKAVVKWTGAGEWECITYYGEPMGLGFSATHFRELKGPGQ